MEVKFSLSIFTPLQMEHDDLKNLLYLRKETTTNSYLHGVGTVPLCPLLVEVITGEFTDSFRSLVGHDANAELADNFARDNSLGAGLTEGSLNAVEGEGRVAPSCHQGLDLNSKK